MNWSAVWTALGAVVLGVGFLWKPAIEPLLNKWLKKHFDEQLANHQHELDKQLEAHKTQLSIEAEGARTNNQRLLEEFGLYTSRKHVVYAELYKRIRGAYDRVEIFREFKNNSIEIVLSLADVEKIFTEYDDILEIHKAGVRDAWETSPETAKHLLEEALDFYDKGKAILATRRAEKYLRANILYLTPATRVLAASTVENIKHWMGHDTIDESPLPDPREASARLIDELENALRDELRAGTVPIAPQT